jgi:hypothetical protein
MSGKRSVVNAVSLKGAGRSGPDDDAGVEAWAGNCFTEPQGRASGARAGTRVGRRKHSVRPHCTMNGVTWAENAPGALAFDGRIGVQDITAEDLVVRAHREGRTVELDAFQTVTIGADGRAGLRLDLARALTAGTLHGDWRLSVALRVPGAEEVPAPGDRAFPTLRFRRRGVSAYARPLAGQDHLTRRLGTVDPVAGVRRRLRRVLRQRKARPGSLLSCDGRPWRVQAPR